MKGIMRQSDPKIIDGKQNIQQLFYSALIRAYQPIIIVCPCTLHKTGIVITQYSDIAYLFYAQCLYSHKLGWSISLCLIWPKFKMFS